MGLIVVVAPSAAVVASRLFAGVVWRSVVCSSVRHCMTWPVPSLLCGQSLLSLPAPVAAVVLPRGPSSFALPAVVFSPRRLSFSAPSLISFPPALAAFALQPASLLRPRLLCA